MSPPRTRLLRVLDNAPLLLFAVVLLAFGSLSGKFLEAENLGNILVQSSSTAIVAIGETVVLLTAGVDLSVGAIMFLSAAVAGKLALGGAPLGVSLLAILLIGPAFGAVNGFLVARARISAFVVTLATLYLGRGLGLFITETRAMNLPEGFLRLGTERIAGVPIHILVFLAVLVLAHLLLTRTPLGRRIYAVGHDLETARKAGLRVGSILAFAYVVSGLCAALGGILSLARLGAVSPTFGEKSEFAAIAAAVLGGTSLFGGRGKVFPGTVLGAVLIQSVENGLVIVNADPYLYPIITSAIIFIAVLIDGLRGRLLARLSERRILRA